MPAPEATVFSLADRIGDAIEEKVADTTLSPATVVVSEELVLKVDDCPEDGSLLVRVVPVDQRFIRTNRAPELEAKPAIVVMVARRVDAAPTAAARRAPGNQALAILAYFMANPRDEENGDELVDSESEVIYLFEDDVFASLQVACAAIRLTYRNQISNA